MQIKRDYSRPLFGKQQGNRGGGNGRPVLFFLGMAVGTLLVYMLVNFATLQEQAMDVLGLSPTATPLPGDLASIAANLVVAGQQEDAAALFERALEQRPDEMSYLYEYGQLLIDMDEPSRALELADHMLELSSGDVRGYALKARAYVWAGNPTAAIPIALTGIDINPSYAPLYSALARAYTNTGDYLDGVDMGLTAIETDPTDVQARRSYAYALSWVSANDEAILQLETALTIDSNNIPTYFELALQYLAQDRDQDAIDLYDRVLAIQPRNAQAMLRLCEAYRKVGQFDRAAGYCEDSVSVDPQSTRALFQLGLLRYNKLNFPGALESFSQCYNVDPENLDCAYRLGLTFYYIQQSNQCVGSVQEQCTNRTQLPYYDTDDCTTAWNLLQDSLVIAQNRQGSDRIIEFIREGLVGIGQVCPEYGAIAPQVDLSLPPLDGEVTPEVNTGEGN